MPYLCWSQILVVSSWLFNGCTNLPVINTAFRKTLQEMLASFHSFYWRFTGNKAYSQMFAMVLKPSHSHAFIALTHTSHCDTDPPLCRSIVCLLSSGWHWLDIPCWASEWRWRSVCLSTGPWADGHIAWMNISVGHNRIMQEAHRCDVPSLWLDGGERSWLFHLSPQELMPRSDKLLICQRMCPSRSRDMRLEKQQINNF